MQNFESEKIGTQNMCKKCPKLCKIRKMPKIAQKRPKTFYKLCGEKNISTTVKN